MYYRGAKAAVCVFDVTNESSYERVITWLRDLKIHADPNIVVCIAGIAFTYYTSLIAYIYIKHTFTLLVHIYILLCHDISTVLCYTLYNNKIILHLFTLIYHYTILLLFILH